MDVKEKTKVPEGVAILLLTIYGYIAVYFYELGYCRAFGIPIDLINPSISNFLTVGGVAIGFLGILFQVLNMFHIVVSEFVPDSLCKTLLYKHGLIVILGVILVIQSYFYWHTVIYFLGFPLLYLLLDVIPPLFEREGGYSENLGRWLSLQKNIPDKGLLNEYVNKNNDKPVMMVLFGVFVLAVLANIGYGSALWKERFSVFDDYALLKIYGSQGIAAKYDKDSNKIISEYMVVDMNGLEFKVVELGHLRKKED